MVNDVIIALYLSFETLHDIVAACIHIDYGFMWILPKVHVSYSWYKYLFRINTGPKLSHHQGPFLSLARSKLRLCSVNHRPGYWSNLPCDWPGTAWAYPLTQPVDVLLPGTRPSRYEGLHINPIHAKFLRGNKNIYLHFMSFLHIYMRQVIEILSPVRQKLTYST